MVDKEVLEKVDNMEAEVEGNDGKKKGKAADQLENELDDDEGSSIQEAAMGEDKEAAPVVAEVQLKNAWPLQKLFLGKTCCRQTLLQVNQPYKAPVLSPRWMQFPGRHSFHRIWPSP